MPQSSSAKAYSQRYYQENKERIKAYARKYYWANREEVLMKYAMKKDEIALYRQDYYLMNKKKIRDSQKEYYQKKKNTFKFGEFKDDEVKTARYLSYEKSKPKSKMSKKEPKPKMSKRKLKVEKLRNICVVCEVFMI